MDSEQFENLRLELRRGCLVLAVLGRLREEQYGYALRKGLADCGMEIEENTLYPLLRRLEGQGLLTSHWREEERRNKRFYRLSAAGETVLAKLIGEWRAIDGSLVRILGSGPHPAASTSAPADGRPAASRPEGPILTEV